MSITPKFVSYTAYGKTHQYYPLVSKKEYTCTYFKSFINNYFENSYPAMASFFAKDENLSLSDLEEIKKMMENEIEKQKSTKND